MVVLATFAFYGCGNSQSGKIDYLPVKSGYNTYSLFDNQGNVICRNQFRGCPTAVVDGMFALKTGGEYQICRVKKDSFKVVRDKLSMAGIPNYGLVPVLDHHGYIKIIDKNGHIAFRINKDIFMIEPGFHHGHIAYLQTIDGQLYAGAMNTKGKVVIEPKYASLYIYGEDLFLVQDKDGDAYYFINAKGKKQTQWRTDLTYNNVETYNEVALVPSPYVLGFDENHHNILFDKKGNVVCDFPERVKSIYRIKNDLVIYMTKPGMDALCGVMRLDGSDVVPPLYRYDHLLITDQAIFAASENESYKYDFSGNRFPTDWKYEWGILDIDGFGLIGKTGTIYDGDMRPVSPGINELEWRTRIYMQYIKATH